MKDKTKVKVNFVIEAKDLEPEKIMQRLDIIPENGVPREDIYGIKKRF